MVTMVHSATNSRESNTFTHTLTSTQLQPRCAKRQLSYYRFWNNYFIKIKTNPYTIFIWFFRAVISFYPSRSQLSVAEWNQKKMYIINYSSKISGSELQSLASLYNLRTVRKSQSVVRDTVPAVILVPMWCVLYIYIYIYIYMYIWTTEGPGKSWLRYAAYKCNLKSTKESSIWQIYSVRVLWPFLSQKYP